MRHPAFSATRSPPRASGRDPMVASAPVPGGAATAPARLLPRLGTSLPAPSSLAALGTVLCLYRPALGGESAGWIGAATVATQTRMDSDGLRESLWFFDRQGQCCWRLYLLPDSDFLAWDRLVSVLPGLPSPDPGTGIGERLWRRLARRLRGDTWRISVLRLHLSAEKSQTLTPSLAPLSALGSGVLQRIALDEAVELPAAFAKLAGVDVGGGDAERR